MSKNQINAKSIARIAAIQTIYQVGDENCDINSLLLRIRTFYQDNDINDDYEIEKTNKVKLRPSYNYLSELVKFTYENLEEIDKIIQLYLASEWSIKSLPKLLLAILRVAVCEVKYFPETPHKVIINEYTDIASDMLDSGEVGFVNSMLDKYASSCR
jgi:transcription antitermination protein NusB